MGIGSGEQFKEALKKQGNSNEQILEKLTKVFNKKIDQCCLNEKKVKKITEAFEEIKKYFQ